MQKTPMDPTFLVQKKCTDPKLWAENFVAWHGGDQAQLEVWFARAIQAGHRMTAPPPT